METVDFEALQREVDRLWDAKEAADAHHLQTGRAEREASDAERMADSDWCWKMNALVKKRQAAGQVWDGQRWNEGHEPSKTPRP